MSRHVLLSLALLCSGALAPAAEGDAPRPPRPDEKGPPPARPDDKGRPHGFGGPSGPGGPGGGPRFGGMPGGMRDTGWDQLSEQEKKQLRSAMEKVWETPEVSAARDKLMRATQDLRDAVRTAVEKADPEAAKALAKLKTPWPMDHRNGGGPPFPRVDDPNFARLATARLGFELGSIAKPEQREAMRHLHERVVSLPLVKEAIAKLEAAPVGERLESFKKLRDVYKQECDREIAEYRARHAKEGTPPLASPEKK